MNKVIHDFIDYAYSNLIWFAFNTVLIFMPLVCIIMLNPKAEILDKDNTGISYTGLMVSVFVINLL